MSLTYQDYLDHLADETIFPKFKIAFLWPDESVHTEIEQDILNESGSLNINYTQGVRRSCNLTLENIDGRYLPSLNSSIWVNKKFKLYLGLQISGETYWNPNGVFIMNNPDAINFPSEKKITISGIDKFAMWDGQLGGEIDSIYQINAGTNVYSAIKSILQIDNKDQLDPILDATYKDEVTPFTIRQEIGSNLGDILIQLSNMLSCDCYYDSEGRLRIESATDDLSSSTKPSLFTYSQNNLEYLGSSLSYQFDKVFNIVKVVGDNINGVQVSASAENDNILSPIRTSLIGSRTKIITDEVIQTSDQAQDRANYELNKISILQSLIKLESTFMAHLDVNACFSLTDDYYGFENERFLIQSLNIPLSTSSKISIDATNIKNLPFYSA